MKTVEDIRREHVEAEKAKMQTALEQCKGNVSAAAKLCEMSRYSFYRKMVKYGFHTKGNV